MDEPDEVTPAETWDEDEGAQRADSTPAPGRHLAEGTGNLPSHVTIGCHHRHEVAGAGA